ncbi:uncharacterized protein LOC122841370 isoform X2 [Gambusia affinis]|uniref:uncharacterized protein LOC122841370 isoform X2 n=1 Tax=Gambusia affinis TaxID=33528 RepID=UPI001CDCD36B|nr:uncharacterized protein LOC122841370 isoform X2 [Gambusia affinis]
MACRESRGGEILAHLVLLVFLVSLCSCAKLTRLKALGESRGTSAHTEKQPERSNLLHGRLLIGQSSQKDSNSTEAALDEADYQADMGWQTRQEKSDWQKMALENLLKMESKVECNQDSMKLLVHDAASTPASLILIDRGHLSPLSLTKLPSSCGYTIRSTQKDLVLVAPYDGCFVIIQENYYVLPLLWWGLPVRMSCPLMGHVSQNPPMVTCHAEGMVVKTDWITSASKIKVNVNGNWESLLTAAQRCVFGIVEHPEGVVISVHYAPCLVEKDGMHSLELAGDVETKVSCPSLLAAQLKGTESQGRGSVQESDMAGKWVYPFPTPYPSLTRPPAQIASQIPSFYQNQKTPSKPNQGSNLGQLPYTRFSGFPYGYLQRADFTTTKRPQTTKPSKFKVTKSADHFYPQTSYPHSPFPAMPRMMQPVTKSPHIPQKPPVSNLPIPEQKFPSTYTEALSLLSNSYPLYLQRLLDKPGPSNPTMSEKGQGEHMPFHLFCSQQMAAAKPSVLSQLAWPEMFKSEVHQLIQLVCIQMEAVLKPPDVSQPPYSDTVKGQVYKPFNLLCALQRSQLQHSKTPQGQVYYSFFLFCYQQKRVSKPADVTRETPKGNLYQALYPFYFQASQKHSGVDEPSQPVTPQAQVYPRQTQKPAVTEPPQSMTPEAHVYSPYFPFYSYPKPTQKPATRPPQSATPQTPVYSPYFPFYPHPKPTQKPATRPSQMATPQAQLHPRFFPYFAQPAPLQKPAVTRPPQSVTSQPQAYPSPFPFYSQPKPTQKPATRPSQMATPQAQVHPRFFPYFAQPAPLQKPAVTRPPQSVTSQPQAYPSPFPFYSQPKATQKPATKRPQLATPQAQVYPPLFQYFDQPHPPQNPAVTLPPRPATPKARVYPPFYYYYTHPQVAQKPAVTQAPQPAASQNKVYEQFPDIYPKPEPPSVPITLSKPQQLQPPLGQVTQPFYSYHLCTLPQSNPTSRSTAEDHKDQEQQKQRCFYSQLLPEYQLANIPTNTPQGYGPCLQYKPPAVEMSERASLANHFYYSQPPVANPLQGQFKNPFNMFYYLLQPHAMQQPDVQQFAVLSSQHKTESPPSKQGDGKAEPQLNTSSLPVSDPIFSQGLETTEILQKPSAPVLQPGAQISPWAPQTYDAYEYFLQPPDGIVALPRSSLAMIAHKGPVSYLGNEFPNPMRSHGAQNMVLPHLEQGKSESPNDPSELWMPDGEQMKPIAQYEPFNIQFPEQTVHSRPNFMPYLGQHGLHVGQLQNKPTAEQRSLHKSEYKSSTHRNFKRAIDRFSFPYYIPGDSPVSNDSVGLNGTREQQPGTGSNNSTKEHKTQNFYSEPRSYVLLQHGPPGKEPNRFRELNYGANSKALKLRRNSHLQTLESLQEKRQELKRLGKGVSTGSHSLGSNYLQRDGDSLGLFISSDPNTVNLHHEQSFSADKLKPEVLKSFDGLWKSRTPSDFSQSFLANVPEKTEVKSATMHQLATEMDKRLQMSKRDLNRK